ncbi:MAG TPA: hypothetical protein ENJ33_02315 [Thiothrix sp.]|nr:hypothetical protein [Thiothrix sp.]
MFILSLTAYLLSPVTNKFELCFHGKSNVYASASDLSVAKHDCCDTSCQTCACGCMHTHLSIPIALLESSVAIVPTVINVDLHVSIVSRSLLPELPPPLI